MPNVLIEGSGDVRAEQCAAGGFVSQLVWSDGQSGALQFGEGEKSLQALDAVLDGLIEDYRQQNGSAR